MNFGSIASLLSVDIFSMEQTENKIKYIYHWSGNNILPLPFRIILSEKQACVCSRVPGTPSYGYSLDIEEDRNQRIKETAGAIY